MSTEPVVAWTSITPKDGALASVVILANVELVISNPSMLAYFSEIQLYRLSWK